MKKCLAFSLLIMLCVFGLNKSAYADDVIYTGTCGANGDNITWTLNATTGDLTLSGTGAMASYLPYSVNTSEKYPPYMVYNDYIKHIEIGEGITSISRWAFEGCNGTSLSLPSTLKSIGDAAFLNCIHMQGKLVIPDSVTYLGDSAFYQTRFDHVVVGKGVTEFVGATFYGCGALKYIEIKGNITKFDDTGSDFLVYGNKEGMKTYIRTNSELVKAHDFAYRDARTVHFVDQHEEITTIPSVAYAESIWYVENRGAAYDLTAANHTTMYPKDSLSKLGFYNGVVGGEADIDGTWSWNVPTSTMPVMRGYTNFKATFTPENTEFFDTVSCDVPVYVTQHDTENPLDLYDSLARYKGTYDPDMSLADHLLAADVSDIMKIYEVKWKDGTEYVPTAGAGVYHFEIRRNPNMGTGYLYGWTEYDWNLNLEQAEMPEEMKVSVEKPETETITYEQKLSDVELPKGWEWKEPDTLPDVSNNGYVALYTPEDTNYKTGEITLPVKVEAKKYIPSEPEVEGYYTYSETLKLSKYKFKDNDLLGTWQWKDADQSAEPEESYEAEFVLDTDNYYVPKEYKEKMVAVNVTKVAGKDHPDVKPFLTSDKYVIGQYIFDNGFEVTYEYVVSYQDVEQMMKGIYPDVKMSDLFDVTGTVLKEKGEDGTLEMSIQEFFDEATNYLSFSLYKAEDKYYKECTIYCTVRLYLDASTVPYPEFTKEQLYVPREKISYGGYDVRTNIELPEGWSWEKRKVYENSPEIKCVFKNEYSNTATVGGFPFVGKGELPESMTVTFEFEPEPTPTPEPTMEPTPEPTEEPTPAPVVTPEPEVTTMPETTAGPTAIPTQAPMPEVTTAPTAQPLSTPVPTVRPTAKPVATVAPTIAPTVTSVPTATPTVTVAPSIPTSQPSVTRPQPEQIKHGDESSVSVVPTDTTISKQSKESVDVSSTKTSSKKKIRLNKKKVVLKKGKKVKLKLLNTKGKKLKWKSSKKKVVTINKKGVIKARKKGKAVIRVRYKGKVYKCKVRVR